MTEPSINNLRRASTAVYLACEESVAADISNLLCWSADEIERLRGELDRSKSLLALVLHTEAHTPADGGRK